MATVFIWNNHMLHSGHKWPGHASMSLDDRWPSVCYDDPDLDRDSYVSWVPQEGLSHRGDRRGIGMDHILDDLMFETYAPDHILRMDRFTPVKLLKMKQAWRAMRDKKTSADDNPDDEAARFGGSYRLYRKNCSDMVSRILKVGSSAGGVHRMALAWTPLQVKRLALAMGARPLTWVAFVKEWRDNSDLSWEKTECLLSYLGRDSAFGSATPLTRFDHGKKIEGRVSNHPDVLEWDPEPPMILSSEQRDLAQTLWRSAGYKVPSLHRAILSGVTRKRKPAQINWDALDEY